MPVSQLPFDPNPDGTCRACRGPIDADTWLCVRCGAAYGDRNRCPHCRTIARTLPHPTFIRRCSVCGQPRLPPGPGIPLVPDEANRQLRVASQSNKIGLILQVLSWLLIALEVPAVPFAAGLIYVSSSGVLTGLGLGLVLIPLLIWLFLRSRIRQVLRQRSRAIDQAYSSAILATLGASRADLDSTAIAKLTGLSLERTEQLLTTLNADERMTSRVTDEGALLFGVQEPAPMRIAEPALAPHANEQTLRVSDQPASAPNAKIEQSEIVDAEFENEADIEGQDRRVRPRP